MTRVVGVHGIGKQILGEESLLTGWQPALMDGLRRACPRGLSAEPEVTMAFYGDLFRPAGKLLAVDDFRYTAADVEDESNRICFLRGGLVRLT